MLCYDCFTSVSLNVCQQFFQSQNVFKCPVSVSLYKIWDSYLECTFLVWSTLRWQWCWPPDELYSMTCWGWELGVSFFKNKKQLIDILDISIVIVLVTNTFSMGHNLKTRRVLHPFASLLSCRAHRLSYQNIQQTENVSLSVVSYRSVVFEFIIALGITQKNVSYEQTVK